MIVKLLKRSKRESDGPGFGKAKWVYQVEGHTTLVVCDYMIEGYLGIPAISEGETLELSILRVPTVQNFKNATDDALIAELAARLEKKS